MSLALTILRIASLALLLGLPPLVVSAQTTVTLQEGLNAYTGSGDAWLVSSDPNTNYNGTTWGLRMTSQAVVLKFAIFQAEGGPVPNGASIVSATLSVYKFWGLDGVFKAERLLRSWQETQATWNSAATGTAWGAPGAVGASDVTSSGSAEGSIGSAAGWVNFDVTLVVQAFAGGTPNYGWRLQQISGDGGTHDFIARDHTSNPTARPKLTITYNAGSSCTSGPYNGSPSQLPGAFEAENFDCGGEGVGYHDTTSSNLGAQYRTAEGVDIIAITGGYAVNNFETSEWMAYTVNVGTTGQYKLAILAANNYATGTQRLHIGIDGVSVTQSVTVPKTGSWSNFQWVEAQEVVTLQAGQHVLKLFADENWFNVDQIRATSVSGSTPYGGTPIQLPATFEAENFDNGGQDVAYHDNVPGNAGGEYRPNEDVDIRLTGSSTVIYNFENQEWLLYTVNVPESKNYDIGILASNNSTAGSFRLQINGVDAGSVTVTPTGGWDNFQWFTLQNVWLDQGQRQIKLVSEQQYFDVDQIRVIASGTPPGGGNPAELLFRSGFEDGVTLGTPTECYGSGCWQYINGSDVAGFTWPPQIWNGTRFAKFQLLADPDNGLPAPTPETIGQYMINRIDPGVGRNSSNALYSEIKKSGCANCGTGPQGTRSTQDPYIIFPNGEPQGAQLYISTWIKLQGNLGDLLRSGDPWRPVFEIKTTDTDWRLNVYVVDWDRDGVPTWEIKTDTYACGSPPCDIWEVPGGAVPLNQWFKLEVFWRRSGGSDGRVWVAVDGNIVQGYDQQGVLHVADKVGANMGPNNSSIDRIFLTQLYSGSPYPIFQWVDDVQIWSDFPVAQDGDAWWDPPYAPH